MNENQQSGTCDDYHCGRWNDTLGSFHPVHRVITREIYGEKQGKKPSVISVKITPTTAVRSSS